MAAAQQTELLPAYLVVGEDALKRETVIKRLRKRMESYGDLSFNLDDFDGEQATGEQIVSACNTMPFASEKRLVIVGSVEKLKKADSELLVSYLGSPSDTTVLLLEAEKLAKSTRLYKACLAVGKTAIIDCAPPARKDLPRQVRAMAPSHGITITDSAAHKLIELVGEDTVRLNNEIAKIALAHRGNDPVNENEVLSLVARTSEIKPWELVNAFSARDLNKCMLYLSRMESASPYSLLASCTTRIRELLCAQSLKRRGNSALLGKALGQPDWRVKSHNMWAQKFTPQELRHALATSRDTERAMKSGTDPQVAFTEWLIATLSPRR